MAGRSRASWLLLCACCIATLALLALAALRFRQATQHNPCTMTYSRPRYRRLAVNQSTAPYELLQYENGDAFKLEPHPVLFIPGSLGSYEQARSIGSVAARSKSLQMFALDLKDEPTAFHAHYVLQQAAFVNEAIKAIRALYATGNATEVPIVLVGHSYGGLAAKLALLLTNHPPNSVDLLVMLSTPVMRPAFHPDASFELVYRTMYSTWRRSLADGGNCTEQAQLNTSSAEFLRCAPHVRNTTLVSVSGGDRDLLVRDGITKIAGPAFDQSFSISSHDLHSVQFGIDHKAILWCNELVTAVVRGIHLWRRVPAEQRGVDFWIEQLTGEARSAAAATTTTTTTNDQGSDVNETGPTTVDGPSADASAARMPYVGAADDDKVTARRNQRLAETMGVLAGAVYVVAVDHLPLILMAFTALGGWTVSRVVLHQLLKLPLDLSAALPLMIPRLSSILHVWVLGPILAQQVLPPPVAAYLLKVSSSSSSSQGGLGSWSVAAAVVAILFGVGGLLSQQGARGISVLSWFLPKLLAFGVAIILWIAIAVVFTLLSKCFAPIRALTRAAVRKMTSSREGRAWRKKWEAARWIGLVVPLGWLVLALASFFGKSHDDQGQRGLREVLLVCLSILFYTAYRTFCVQWLATVLWPASGREGYQLLLAGLYFPVLLLGFPTATLTSRVLFDQHPLPAVYGVLLGDLSIYLLSLIAVIAHLHLARHKPLNVPAVEQWHRLIDEWTQPQVSSNPAGPHSACLHEDGGDHAVYEISDQPCVKLAPGVYLGPMFRVAWCDCSRNPKLPSAEYCDWCKCPRCGNRGGSLDADRLQRLDEIPASAAFALVVVGVSLFVPWWVGEYTFRNMFALAAMAASLAVQHVL